MIAGSRASCTTANIDFWLGEIAAKSKTDLKWQYRHKIALGAASALRYLHEECRVGCIVHRDMRPNNILLTHDFTPLVSFFLRKFNCFDPISWCLTQDHRVRLALQTLIASIRQEIWLTIRVDSLTQHDFWLGDGCLHTRPSMFGKFLVHA